MILIVGPTPPDVGGVATHIERIGQVCRKRKTDWTIENLSPKRLLRKYGRFGYPVLFHKLIRSRADLFHFHKPDNSVLVWAMIWFLVRQGRRVVFTFHNENLADQIESGAISGRRLSLTMSALKGVSHIVCVNHRMCEALINNGIARDRISVVPAFIPQQDLDTDSLPPQIKQFVAQHSPTLVGYSQRYYLYNGFDRYGGDMMLDLVSALSKEYPNCGLVFVFPGSEGGAALEMYRQTIRAHGIQDNILVCSEFINLAALFKLVDIHVRPSNTDGDPIAVRESIHLGVPTIASDCTFKPEGTIFHKDRDVDDLVEKTRRTLTRMEEERERVRNASTTDYSVPLLGLYEKLVE